MSNGETLDVSKIVRVVCGSLFVIIIVVVLATGAVQFAGQDGGDLATWVSALATLVALLAAGTASYFAYSAYQLEVQRDRDLQEDRVRAQAALVAAWPDGANNGFSPTRDGTPALKGVNLWIRNASELPVTNVQLEVRVRLPDSREAETEFFGRATMQPVLPPGGEPQPAFVETSTPVASTRFVGLTTTPMNRVAIVLAFVDAAGVKWCRTSPPGQLLRVRQTNSHDDASAQ